LVITNGYTYKTHFISSYILLIATISFYVSQVPVVLSNRSSTQFQPKGNLAIIGNYVFEFCVKVSCFTDPAHFVASNLYVRSIWAFEIWSKILETGS